MLLSYKGTLFFKKWYGFLALVKAFCLQFCQRPLLTTFSRVCDYKLEGLEAGNRYVMKLHKE